MKKKIRTIVQWNDPKDRRHEPGEVSEIDTEIVSDLEHLVQDRTVEIIAEIALPLPPPSAPKIEEKTT